MKKRKLFIIEGLWCTGKTTLCRYLEEEKGFYYIKEPNHVEAGVHTGLDNWYREAHVRNFKKAVELTRKGKKVVVERSLFFAVAYEKIYNERDLTRDFLSFRKMVDRSGALLFYLIVSDWRKIIDCMDINPDIKKYAQREKLKKLDKVLQYYLKGTAVRKIKSDNFLIDNFNKAIYEIKNSV
jgi:hypothetical protein